MNRSKHYEVGKTLHVLKQSVVLVVGFLLFFASWGVCFADTTDDSYLVLLGGTLIDGTGADPVPDSAVVIQGERILYAGPADTIELPTGAEVIQLDGLTILPGFIDSHVHSYLLPGHFTRWAREGVTTVRDLGSNESELAEFRDQFPPTPERARLVAAGPLITVPDGYPIVPFGWEDIALPVTSPEDAREKAERLLDGPADLIKISLETGAIWGIDIPVLSLAEASMVVQVAHGRGTVVSAHVQSVTEIELALDSGVDDLAHMVVDQLLPIEQTEAIVANDITWVPTLAIRECKDAHWETWVAVLNLQRFLAAGGRVALGTDRGLIPCRSPDDLPVGMPMTEIRLMRFAGMTPMEIIVAATRNGARVCNLEHELGTLEAGKIADLFVVYGDPLADLEVLQNVVGVIHDGVIIRDDREEGPNREHGALAKGR